MAEQKTQVERSAEGDAPADDGVFTLVVERPGQRSDEQEGQGGPQQIDLSKSVAVM